MIEIILKSVLALYFLFGFISWLIGMKSFGGSKAYKEHLRRETKHSNFFFYVVFICFIFNFEKSVNAPLELYQTAPFL